VDPLFYIFCMSILRCISPIWTLKVAASESLNQVNSMNKLLFAIEVLLLRRSCGVKVGCLFYRLDSLQCSA
jgi:hypothetical protein